MRVWLPHLVVAAIVLVVAVLLLSSIEADARRYLVTDSFSSPDGSDPDVNKWVVDEDGNQDLVQISDDRLMTWSQDTGHAYCRMLTPFSSDNITLTVEFSVETVHDRCFDVTLVTGDGTDWHDLLAVRYEDGFWGHERWWGAGTQENSSAVGELVAGRWYVAELDVFEGNASFSVWERDTFEHLWCLENVTLDDPMDRSYVTFGVDAYVPGSTPETWWDNLTLVDPVSPPNAQPRWSAVPQLDAVEDEPFFHDFQRYITDDQEPWELRLESASGYVVGIDGFEVEFLFPNGVVTPSVILAVSDGHASVPHTVPFLVTQVNDPPEHAFPDSINVPEGIPTFVDLSDYIWDIDSEDWELQIILSSPYVSVSGLELEVSFPEGITEYRLDLAITDGHDTVETSVTFYVTRVNNPPLLLPLDDMTVTEDTPTVLDLSPLVSDPDDPPEDLVVTVSADDCTVDGLNVTLLFTEGGYTATVLVRVSDGFGWDQRSFDVRILERNDPPVIGDIPVQVVSEDEETMIDLGPWISDEDHEGEQLTLSLEHSNALSIEGLAVAVLFTEGGSNATMFFQVSDGTASTEGRLRVRVLEVNDLPRITGIGRKEAPYHFWLATGTERSYGITAVDEDDRSLDFSLDSSWMGLAVRDDLLVVSSNDLDEGDHVGYLNVYDDRGGSDRVRVTVHVVPRSQVPVDVNIVSPVNQSWFASGEVVELRVRVLDPEGYLDDRVTVTWSSDVVGQLATVDLTGGGNVSISDLPQGRHRIFVDVTDGELTFTHWTEVHVGSVSTGSSDDGGGVLCTALALLFVIIATGVVLGAVVARGGKDVEPEPPARRVEAVATSTDRPGSREDVAARDREARSRRVEAARRADRREAARGRAGEEARESRIRSSEAEEARRKAAMERTFMARRPEPPAPPTAPPTAGPVARAPGAPVPTTGGRPGVRKDQLVKALESLPGGLPPSLSLYDAPTIANRILKGRQKRAPDGRSVAFVQGAWYYVDPGDGEFMRPYEGP